jgi:hypothetical protein
MRRCASSLLDVSHLILLESLTLSRLTMISLIGLVHLEGSPLHAIALDLLKQTQKTITILNYKATSSRSVGA